MRPLMHSSSSRRQLGQRQAGRGETYTHSTLSCLLPTHSTAQHITCCLLHPLLRAVLLLQLLWELDNGRSVGLSGVPDDLLRAQLQHTLELLGLKCTKVGIMHACMQVLCAVL